jgi:hypothetical protein
MTKFLAAAHDPDSLLARRARQKSDGDTEAPRTAEPRQEPKGGAADAAIDADMLDLIAKFEQNYAELAPPREEPPLSPLSDDLFPEFPEPFDSSPAPRNRTRTLELARFEPQGSREAPLIQTARAELRPAIVDEQAEIDEAFSILKAAEAKGAAKAQRAADDAQALAAERAVPPSDVHPEFRPAPKAESRPETERVDWAARSHRPRTIALAAGVLVLALGLTMGFIAGRAPHGKPQVTIQTTQQGGTLLRLDRELRKR